MGESTPSGDIPTFTIEEATIDNETGELLLEILKAINEEQKTGPLSTVGQYACNCGCGARSDNPF